MRFEEVHNRPGGRETVERFLNSAGSSLKTFRYFSSRHLSVIRNHELTLIAFDDRGDPVGYGHLDRQEETVWMGICVTEAARGGAVAGALMKYLMAHADSKNIRVTLTVDDTNVGAIELYKHFGFIEIDQGVDAGNIVLMERPQRGANG